MCTSVLQQPLNKMPLVTGKLSGCPQSHNEEIHELKSKLLTTFAQLEDARVLKQRNNDPRYLQLLRLRGLDPLTALQKRNIESNYHYLETGLRDVNGCLDAQWEEFHQRKSRREGR